MTNPIENHRQPMPTRGLTGATKVLISLLNAGEATPNELAGALHMRVQSVTSAIRTLRTEGFEITKRHIGKREYSYKIHSSSLVDRSE